MSGRDATMMRDTEAAGCVRYTKEGTQFGRLLAESQAVQRHLARIAAETAALRAASQAAVAAGIAWTQVAAAIEAWMVRAGPDALRPSLTEDRFPELEEIEI
jgi:alkylation response protein AidB-like acyl-CoA dehydrogenase